VNISIMKFSKSTLKITPYPMNKLIMGMIYPRNASHVADSKPTLYGQMKLSEVR
jgi:hypothetical protein